MNSDRFAAGVPGIKSGLAVVLTLALAIARQPAGIAAAEGGSDKEPQFVDLSLLVAPEFPCTWPAAGFPPFHMNPYLRIGPLSPYNSDILAIDGNTGTQLDVPPHSVPHPDSKLPNAGPYGRMYTDKVPAWQFCGEACVVDCRDLVESAAPGASALVTRDRIAAWEREHRPLSTGDVVLLRSGYTDRFYRPLPEGRRFAADPVAGRTPAWPDPDPDCMEYLASRKVMALATDSASMGPLPDLAEPTHLAGLKYGMIWTESATGLDKLPATGAFYCMLSPKHADGAYSEGRAIAIVGDPLARRLIESARKKQVVDLSVVLSTDLPVTWPGPGAGNHRQPYLKVPLFFAPNLGTFHVTHMLDAHAGTHLVPPAYALPPPGFENGRYAPEVQAWLAEYEQKYGPRGTSSVTTEQVPLQQTCGPARVIDVKHRIGTTDTKTWPNSPEITVADIEQYEKQLGPLKPGDIVIFKSGYTDAHFKPLPQGLAFMSDPLNGKREGWPAPGPDAIIYLAGRGIRCVATDGPTLGGAEPKRAIMAYWALATKGMVAVEFLTNVDRLPKEAYFIFAPVKIRGCHGGPGRAIALY
ncbi:MAG: cyclase family protein [Planctomycetia bacterium]|nr:cyclase family protein [Planctomycetia bacterium]